MGDDREVFGHLVDYELTEEEAKEKLLRNADIDRAMGDIKAQKSAANSGFNEDLKTLRKEQVTLLESIKSGKARVEVQCYLDKDIRLSVMRTLRADNGEQVDERALTADELNEDRQGSLFEGAAPKADADAPEGEDEEEQSDPDLDATLAAYQAQNGDGEPAGPGDDDPESDDDDESDESDAAEARPH